MGIALEYRWLVTLLCDFSKITDTVSSIPIFFSLILDI